MKKEKSSIDGFIPRRAGSQIGGLHNQNKLDKTTDETDRSLHTGDNQAASSIGVARQDKMIGRDDIDESLRQIDDEPESKKQRKQRRRGKGPKRPKSEAKRIIKWSVISLLIIGALVGGYVLVKLFLAGSNIFQGNLFDLVQNQRLKEDENGRSNFVVFGTAEDDEGGNHDGANLTDSIMVISVDQDEKNAYMINLPRDLWVTYDPPCVPGVGYQGKINAVYTCASNDGQDEAAGAAALQKMAGSVLGLDIQYYAHLNFTAVVESVDAVGGVDVTIESNPPGIGILDRNFDWKCNYTCYYVNYDDGETVHLDGEHALALARARNASGGYGLSQGNFDREKNQQKILRALQEKAISAGTLTNLGAVTGLIDALGNNIRTNVQTNEIRTLMDIGANTKQSNIFSLTLVDEDDPLVTTGNLYGQSIVQPIAGLFDYSAIQDYVSKNLSNDPLIREEPHVSVLNGGGASGEAQAKADQLSELGFVVDAVTNAPTADYKGIVVYQLNDEKPSSAAKLSDLFGVEVLTTAPPVSVVGDTDFLIIVGSAGE